MSRSGDRAPGWEALLEQLAARQHEARAMGGPEKLERQHRGDRLDARQRLEVLCDKGSFQEIGALVGSVAHGALPAAPADAIVGGLARIEGRPLVVAAEDFTVQGGSIGLGNHAKRVRLVGLALQERVPLVLLLEGAGERVTNALERYPHAPNDLQVMAQLSGRVPTLAVVLGASAGHGALTGLLADFVVMVEGAALFSAGPPVVAQALGEQVSKQELGGAALHTRESGVAHNAVASEAEALALVRAYLSYFPSSAWQRPPIDEAGPDREARQLDDLLEIIPTDPNRPYDMRAVIECVGDRGAFLEIQPHYGDSILTGLLRLGGWPVGIVANQPAVQAGSITREAAEKAAHFLELMDAFHFPVVFLADNPGIMAGSRAERAGTLRSAARMFAAQSRLRSPKLHVTLRKAYGFGSSLMAMNPFDGQTLTLALPGSSLGAMPAEAGSDAVGADPEERRRLAEAAASGTWKAADALSYDRIIDPRELRTALIEALCATSARAAAAPLPAAHPGIRP